MRLCIATWRATAPIGAAQKINLGFRDELPPMTGNPKQSTWRPVPRYRLSEFSEGFGFLGRVGLEAR